MLCLFISLNPYKNCKEYLIFPVTNDATEAGRQSNFPGHAILKWQNQNTGPGQLAPGFVSLTPRLYCLSLARQKKSAFRGHQSQRIWVQETVHSLLRWVREGRQEGPKPCKMQTHRIYYSPTGHCSMWGGVRMGLNRKRPWLGVIRRWWPLVLLNFVQNRLPVCRGAKACIKCSEGSQSPPEAQKPRQKRKWPER